MIKMRQKFDKFNTLISSNRILLVSHINPDGDNIGSMLALGIALSNDGMDITMANVDPVPSDYLFLNDSKRINNLKELNIADYNVLVTLDVSDLDRIGDSRLLDFKGIVVNIDHHITNSCFGDLNILDATASATGEIVYEYIKYSQLNICQDVANSLYTAISTDSGSFKYSSVTSKTHLIISELISYGVDVGTINIELYQKRSVERTNLFIEAMKTLHYYADHRIALITVTQDMLNDTDTKSEDTEGLIDFVRDIGIVEIAVLMKEIDQETYKISFRSKNEVDVSSLAGKFGGGGHKRAAGATITGNYKDVLTRVIDAGEKELNA